ncbi:hypothetical protein [Planococcus donghaensis]|uniref:hypothetical protein n=1 Tax=Planococcus donghaensis TaxID=414778 RepID=UPI0037352434
MVERVYYSQRKNNDSKTTISFESLLDYFDGIYSFFSNKGYLVKVPKGSVAELNLLSIEIFNKEYLLPFREIKQYTEEDIFDLIEYFFDCLEMPVTFKIQGITAKSPNSKDKIGETKQELQENYRERINRIISKYGVGYELTAEGYVREILNNGLEHLIDSEQALLEDVDSENRIKYAKELFLKHGATEADRRGSILEIAAVLEKLRDSKQLELTGKDAGELFAMLNSFNIRHNRKDQKSDYDKEIFYPWMFYNLLAAVDASLKLQMKK